MVYSWLFIGSKFETDFKKKVPSKIAEMSGFCAPPEIQQHDVALGEKEEGIRWILGPEFVPRSRSPSKFPVVAPLMKRPSAGAIKFKDFELIDIIVPAIAFFCELRDIERDHLLWIYSRTWPYGDDTFAEISDVSPELFSRWLVEEVEETVCALCVIRYVAALAHPFKIEGCYCGRRAAI